MRNKLLPVFCLLLVSAAAHALTGSMGIYVADRYYYRYYNDPSAGRIQYDVTLAQDIASDVNFSVNLWSSYRMSFLEGGLAVPEEFDLYPILAWTLGDWALGLSAAIVAYPGSVLASPGTSIYSFGAFADWFYPSEIDFLAFSAETGVYYNLTGWYAELKATPGLNLPAAVPLEISIPLTFGFATAGYSGIITTGPTGFSAAPALRARMNDNWSLRLTGGYFLSLSPDNPSYPFVMLDTTFAFESASSEKP